MATSERAVARLETGAIDPHLSTVARFADAIGKRVEWRLVDRDDAVGEADG
jgi:predicted transcriptional regulator